MIQRRIKFRKYIFRDVLRIFSFEFYLKKKSKDIRDECD